MLARSPSRPGDLLQEGLLTSTDVSTEVESDRGFVVLQRGMVCLLSLLSWLYLAQVNKLLSSTYLI